MPPDGGQPLPIPMLRVEHTLVWSLSGAMNRDVKVSQVIFVRHSIDPRDTIPVSSHLLDGQDVETHGSAIRRSVSLIIRLGKAMSNLATSGVD